jgi:hypothetical protein
MNPTPDDAELLRLKAMTPAAKLAVMHGLIRMAWKLKFAWVQSQFPHLDPREVAELTRTQLFGRGS